MNQGRFLLLAISFLLALPELGKTALTAQRSVLNNGMVY